MTTHKLGHHRRPVAKRNETRVTKNKLPDAKWLRASECPSTDIIPPVEQGEHDKIKNAVSFVWLTEFDEADEPIFVHDKAFRILRCNAAYAACAGQPMDAIIGKLYWQVFPKISGARGHEAEPPSRERIEAGSEFSTSAGEIFLTRDITTHRASGEFWYSRHSLENITTRKRDDDAKDREVSFLEAIIAGTPGIFTVTDRQGRLMRWNAGLNALTGRSDAELRDAPPLSLVSEVDKERMAAKREEAFSTGHAQGEIRMHSAGQGVRDLVFSARRFEVEGVPYLVSFILDKTEVNQLASDLVREKAISDTIIESAPGAFFMLNEEGKLIRWNQFLRNETGLTDEQLLDCHFVSAIHEDDQSLATVKFLTAFATGYADMEVRVPTRNQGIRYFFKTARRFDVDGVPYVAGFCVDVTKRKEAEAALVREKAFSDVLIESAPGAFFVIDCQGNFHRWNSYLNRLTGLSDQELRQRPWLLTITEEDRPLAAAMMKKSLETGYAQEELHVRTCERGVRLYFMTARRFQVGADRYLVGVGLDTTNRSAHIQELEHEAQTDPLTQIAHRGRFLEIAKHEFDRCRRYGHALSLWMLDVDHFKAINDTYGHQAGDAALQSLVAISQQALRDWDIMGRMGGEEFAVLLPETDTSQALLVAERLRQTVAATGISVDEGKTVRVTVSTGIATAGADDTDVEMLLARADHALYEAKQSGRDKVCVA